MKTQNGLRVFSKLTCFSTLFLIFVGGMVTSTGSGLSVPDWPLSYGTLFPPMVGGVFYEHGHRMVAGTVGFLTLLLTIWVHFKEKRKWVKVAAYFALLAVICQGVLGGITVLFYLPPAISVSHAVLAQTFFLLTILLAYSFSLERQHRLDLPIVVNVRMQKASLILVVAVYIQLILGAIMRHTGSGLAIYDFPTMGGEWWPVLNKTFLAKINVWRFQHGLDPVKLSNVIFHLLHRIGALGVCAALVYVNLAGRGLSLPNQKQIHWAIWALNLFVLTQIFLGAMTVLTLKQPVVTSLHVMCGATILGLSFLLFLRVLPISLKEVRWR